MTYFKPREHLFYQDIKYFAREEFIQDKSRRYCFGKRVQRAAGS